LTPKDEKSFLVSQITFNGALGKSIPILYVNLREKVDQITEERVIEEADIDVELL